MYVSEHHSREAAFRLPIWLPELGPIWITLEAGLDENLKLAQCRECTKFLLLYLMSRLAASRCIECDCCPATHSCCPATHSALFKLQAGVLTATMCSCAWIRALVELKAAIICLFYIWSLPAFRIATLVAAMLSTRRYGSTVARGHPGPVQYSLLYGCHLDQYFLCMFLSLCMWYTFLSMFLSLCMWYTFLSLYMHIWFTCDICISSVQPPRCGL